MNREREMDVEIIAEMREHISEHDAMSRDGRRIWSLSRYTPPAMFEEFTVAATQEIDRLTAERDRVRDILRRLLDAFGTPATRETETNLSEAMTAYEAADMKDEAHVLRTTIEAIGAALGIESEAGE